MPPRIFISHKASDDPQLLWRVHDALKAAGFDVLMDQARLQPGQRWRDEIYTWIYRAHGAVVLLTPEALGAESHWVKFELAALAPRRFLDQVKLVPLLVPPLTPAILHEKVFDPYDLRELEAMSVGADAPDAVARVVETFRPLLADFRETPVDRLETVLQNELPPEPHVLERAAIALQADEAADARHVARSFFHAPPGKVSEALAAIAGGRGVSASQLEKVLEIVTPFWIAPEAVIELAREASELTCPHSILLLNSTHRAIGSLYVRRAALQYPLRWRLVSVTATGADDPAGAIGAEIRHWFRDRDDAFLDDADDAEVDAHIASTARSGPVIVVLPAATRLETVGKLQDRFPTCIFIRLAGADIPDDATLLQNRSIVLEPRLEADREQTIKTAYSDCRNVVKNVPR